MSVGALKYCSCYLSRALKKCNVIFYLLNVIILNDMTPRGFWRINGFSCENRLAGLFETGSHQQHLSLFLSLLFIYTHTFCLSISPSYFCHVCSLLCQLRQKIRPFRIISPENWGLIDKGTFPTQWNKSQVVLLVLRYKTRKLWHSPHLCEFVAIEWQEERTTVVRQRLERANDVMTHRFLNLRAIVCCYGWLSSVSYRMVKDTN